MAFYSQIEPADPAMWANPSYFTMLYGISWGLSRLCQQRLMARVLARTGVLSSLAVAEGGGLRLDLYSDTKVYPGPDLERWLSCKFIASPATSR